MSLPINPTISIRPYKDEESGDWRVDCIVTGLGSEEKSLLAADYLTALLCGQEIQPGGAS